jgi:phospholipid methyltransferase
LLVAISWILPVWAILLFRREGTEVEPTSPTNRKLVTSGPYQFTRNPMYLGLVILTLGIAIWVGAWPMFGAPVALFATANWVHIPFEEVKMRRQFGVAYDSYVASVRRWIWRQIAVVDGHINVDELLRGMADIRGMSASPPKVDNGSGNLRLVQHLQLSGKRPRVRDYRDITKT